MRLEMRKGKEASLIVEDAVNSIKYDGFLADTYTEAFDTLCDHVKCSVAIRKEMADCKSASGRNEILYRAPQNIIAFSGKRGSGKTSTMLSFSEALKNPNKLRELQENNSSTKDYSALAKQNFVILDPIDPTAIEENQSFLSVVLSRLLFKAEENWNQQLNFYGSFRDRESEKAKLLTLARSCLNGIRSIKDKKSSVLGLSDLQRVGDASILKKNLYDFVEIFLRFGSTRECFKPQCEMLVIQIDDTDCQIYRGYEVMEDIRKYLTIPNVVVLMAIDTKLLRPVLMQHYVLGFHENLNRGLIHENEIRSLGEKYMAKLLPPTHVIHLPSIDKCIREKMSFLHLYYLESNKNILLNICNEKGDNEKKKEEFERYNFQSVVLRYIYKKTHIVFCSHDAYINNIIPTTLRGIAYLLDLLSSMEDVPEIDFSIKAEKQSEEEFLAERLELQFPVLERNLDLFENYFLNDWLQAKLPQNMLEIIEKLSNKVPDQRIPFLIKEVRRFYEEKEADIAKKSQGNGASQEVEKKAFLHLFSEAPLTYRTLDGILRNIQGTTRNTSIQNGFRSEEDFLFIFAIRTLLTIKNNRDILKVKRRAVDKYHNNKERREIVFECLKGKTSLPTEFYLEEMKLYGYSLVFEREKNKKDMTYWERVGRQYFFQPIGFNKNDFNFTGAIIEWLYPGNSLYRGTSQQKIFKAQELAILMAVNCDLQESARKTVARKVAYQKKVKKEFVTRKIKIKKIKVKKAMPVKSAVRNHEKADSLKAAVEKGLLLVQKAITEINEGMLQAYDANKNIWDTQKKRGRILDDFEPRLKRDRKKEEEKRIVNMIRDDLILGNTEDRKDDFVKERKKLYNLLNEYLETRNLKLKSEYSEKLTALMNFTPIYDARIVVNEQNFEKIKEELIDCLEKFFA